MQSNKENLIVGLTFDFSLSIVEFTEELQVLKKFNLANQLFRSVTSFGSNVREAQNAESKVDFIHKMKVAAKEGDETEYWLLLCEKAPSYPGTKDLLERITSINKILSKIISSSKKQSSNHQSPNYQIIKLKI